MKERDGEVVNGLFEISTKRELGYRRRKVINIRVEALSKINTLEGMKRGGG